ncbi:MAG TPA: ATP-binding cassette domain-containing protein [Gaiellaceae bacterium]|jgi:peptide/nickel transport system ATP-binding protein
MSEAVVEVSGLCVDFAVTQKAFRKRRIEAVRSVDLALHPQELVALVGESGSGKTTIARTMAGLIQQSAGQITYRGVELDRHNRRMMHTFRKRRSIVFQNPYQSLNPRMRVESTLREALKVAGLVPKADVSAEIDRLLQSVGLPVSYRQKYPLALSGGERQRVAIARALAAQPDLLIADEITSALDVSVSAQIVNLLLDLKSAANFACLLITHDLALALAVADSIAIMKSGEIVERGTPNELRGSQEAYTRELLDLAAVSTGSAPPA